MKIKDLLFESKNIEISSLDTLIKKSNKPFYIVVAGSVGSGKSFIVDRDLKDIHIIDPDKFTVELGNGVYDSKHVAKSMAMVKKAVLEKLSNKETFIQQGTSANLQSTINKLKNAKEHGYKTVLLYIDTPIEQAIKQIEKRLSNGGHGESIDRKKVENTSNGAKLTFRALSGVDIDKATEDDLERVEDALSKTVEDLKQAQNFLDYYIKMENIY